METGIVFHGAKYLAQSPAPAQVSSDLGSCLPNAATPALCSPANPGDSPRARSSSLPGREGDPPVPMESRAGPALRVQRLVAHQQRWACVGAPLAWGHRPR